jgi:plasmid rolling circle replication initiator protein Rep
VKNLINDFEVNVEELEHFDELDFFLKKYNGLFRTIELVQDVFSKKELERFSECATYLRYAIFKNDGGLQKRLIHANFCRNRWCSVCNWRRALKYRHILNKRIKKIISERKVKFIFVTFTIKNTYFKNIDRDLRLLLNGFNRLMNYKVIKQNPSILGYVRSLEFTIQKDNLEYINLHIHTLFVVTPGYFDTRKNYYLNHRDWTYWWQRALKISYTPIVDVRLVKKRKKSKYNAEELAVFEVIKYILKDTDLLKLQKAKRVDIFKELYDSMKNVRNLAFGGILAPKNFEKDEEKEEDLVKIGDEDLINGELVGEAVYVLKNGFYELKDFKKVNN